MAADKPASRPERRRETRMSLRLPVRVQGHDAQNQAWEEMAAMENTSYGGAAMRMKRPVVRGQVLSLSLPLPKHFRHYDLSEAFYRVYALVRHIVPATGELRVGVLFLGKSPPKGYEANPGGLYLLPTDPPPVTKEERRKWPRTARYEITQPSREAATCPGRSSANTRDAVISVPVVENLVQPRA